MGSPVAWPSGSCRTYPDPVIEVGERAPDFVLPDAAGALVRFYGSAGGRPTAVFLPAAAAARCTDLARAVAERPEFATCWIAQYAADVSSAPPAGSVFVDADGAVSARFRGAEPAEVVIVLDPSLRVAGVLRSDVAPAELLALLGAVLHGPDEARIAVQAPVLMVPRVVDAASCARLIDQCRATSTATGVEVSDGGASSNQLDRKLKRRSDVVVDDPDQLQELVTAVGRRIMPEVRRAFAYRATRFEGFKIAAYDESDRGFFAPHRDNLTPSTAHRVFGLSVNLNEDYDGGELSFPEYGGQRYRAPAGGAMVFSCDLLHAVHPVARGTRFVLLSFLFS